MTDPAVVVREAVAADVEALHGLIVAIAEHHGQREWVPTEPATLREHGFGRSPAFGAILAEVDGALIGYASYTWNYSIWLGSTYMNIDDVFVAATRRGAGVGAALMHGAREACRARGHHRIRWEVQADNVAAISFYERLGARMRTKGVFGWDV